MKKIAVLFFVTVLVFCTTSCSDLKQQSTVAVPITVTFYKDGAQVVSTDKQFNHKIAKHIESCFPRNEVIVATLAVTSQDIKEMKYNETAIELQFDEEINFYSGVLSDNVRTLFIPITGENKYMMFKNTLTSPNSWSGPICGVKDLEQFFDEVQFAPAIEK